MSNKNINNSVLEKLTDFTDELNRVYASVDGSTTDGYIIITELIQYIIDQGGAGGDMLKSIYDTDNSGIVDDSELINGDTVANDSAVAANTLKVSYSDSGNVVLKTTAQTIAGEKTLSEELKVNPKIIVDPDQVLGLTTGYWFGDGNSGFYQSDIATIKLRINTVDRWVLNQSSITGAIIDSIQLTRQAATSTLPIYTFLGDSDTGIGKAAANELSLIAGGVEGARVTENQFTTNGQAHGGNNLKTFSASATFDATDGNNQKMVTTANTTIALSNELPGTYIIKLLISGTVTAITVGASIGTKLPNASLDFDYTDGAVNLVTIVVDPDGVKDYTITN